MEKYKKSNYKKYLSVSLSLVKLVEWITVMCGLRSLFRYAMF